MQGYYCFGQRNSQNGKGHYKQGTGSASKRAKGGGRRVEGIKEGGRLKGDKFRVSRDRFLMSLMRIGIRGSLGFREG